MMLKSCVKVLALLAVAGPVLAYPDRMCDPDRCTKPLIVGEDFGTMGVGSLDALGRVLSVFRGSVALRSGDSYLRGETLRVVFSITPASTDSKAILEVLDGALGTFQSDCCSGRRRVLESETEAFFVVNDNASGDLVFNGAWSLGPGADIHLPVTFLLKEAKYIASVGCGALGNDAGTEVGTALDVCMPEEDHWIVNVQSNATDPNFLNLNFPAMFVTVRTYTDSACNGTFVASATPYPSQCSAASIAANFGYFGLYRAAPRTKPNWKGGVLFSEFPTNSTNPCSGSPVAYQ